MVFYNICRPIVEWFMNFNRNTIQEARDPKGEENVAETE